MADQQPDQQREQRDRSEDRNQHAQRHRRSPVAAQADGRGDLDGLVLLDERIDAPVLPFHLHGLESIAALGQQDVPVGQVHEGAARVPHLHDEVVVELRKESAGALQAVVAQGQRHLLQLVIEKPVRLVARGDPGRAARGDADDELRREQRYEEFSADGGGHRASPAPVMA